MSSSSKTNHSPKQAIVIGAGFAGIASALRLRAKGYQVKIIDRCSMLGGRAQVFTRGKFKPHNF